MTLVQVNRRLGNDGSRNRDSSVVVFAKQLQLLKLLAGSIIKDGALTGKKGNRKKWVHVTHMYGFYNQGFQNTLATDRVLQATRLQLG